MATQNPDFSPINFSITQPFTNVRLLEAPEEVLEIIAKGEPLKFKSAPASGGHNGSSDGKEGYLHLCSKDKAWAVKQVSTSNSVYIVRPTDQQPAAVAEYEGDGDAMEVEMVSAAAPAGAITAFAKPTNILELYKVPADGYEGMVKEHLRRTIPNYSPSYSESALGRSSVSLQRVYNDTPAPDAVIQRVMASLCVFELKGSCYLPSESALLATWKKVVEATTIAETELNSIHAADISKLLKDEDDPASVAIAETMFTSDGMFDIIGLRDTSTEPHSLKEMDVARWAGNLLLAQHKSAAIAADAFISKWEDLVPAGWIKFCSLEVLGGACESEKTGDDEETVRWKPFVTVAEDVGSTSRSAAHSDNANAKPAPDAATATGKRKWHEKFAAQRNNKK